MMDIKQMLEDCEKNNVWLTPWEIQILADTKRKIEDNRKLSTALESNIMDVWNSMKWRIGEGND